LGQKYVTPSLAEKLSDREFEVFKMIVAGKTVKEIADNLFISAKTVSTYKIRIFEKMNMEGKAYITSYAIKNKLID